MFLIKRNSLEIEYLAANSIAGATTNYPIGANFKKGGYLVALATWTIDGGFGPEDKLACLTNKGELAVFSGADPATWSFQGVYQVGVPMGLQPMMKYGGDLLVITETGLFPLSSAVQSTSIDRVRTVSELLRPLLSTFAGLYSGNQGWEILIDPLTPYLMVNIPSTPIRKQVVMQSQTSSWCVFTGLNAICFARMGKQTYFGTADKVCKMGGVSDAGANITGTMFQAYNRLKYQQNKKVSLIRPYISSNGGFSYNLAVATNFVNPKEINTVNAQGNVTAAIWGTSLFGIGTFSGDTVMTNDWQSVSDEYGLWKSIYLQITSNNAVIKYFGCDLLYMTGGNF